MDHSRSRPNVVLVVADDLAIGDLGAYGARSVLRALRSRRRVDRGDIFYYDDIAPDGHCNAVRRGDWKLHVNRVPGPYFTGRQFSATEQLPQLFNLRRDPEESYDLSEHHPEIVETLAARIAEFDAELRADQRARYGAP